MRKLIIDIEQAVMQFADEYRRCRKNDAQRVARGAALRATYISGGEMVCRQVGEN